MITSSVLRPSAEALDLAEARAERTCDACIVAPSLIHAGKSSSVAQRHRAPPGGDGAADWIIGLGLGLGPGAGHERGRIVFEGTPANLAAFRSTLTGELVAVTYLGEAIVYAAVRSRRVGTRKGPGPALQALWVVFAALLILGGLFALSASGAPAALVAIAIGVIIVGWVWTRVARASGESTLVFLARIGRQIVETVRRAITSGGP